MAHWPFKTSPKEENNSLITLNKDVAVMLSGIVIPNLSMSTCLSLSDNSLSLIALISAALEAIKFCLANSFQVSKLSFM